MFLSQNAERRTENGNRRWHHCCSKRSNAKFLPDRTLSFRDAVRYIEQEFRKATTFPIVVIAIKHDTTGVHCRSESGQAATKKAKGAFVSESALHI